MNFDVTGAGATTIGNYPGIGGSIKPVVDTLLVSISKIKGMAGYSASIVEELAKPMEIDVNSINDMLGRLQQAITRQQTITGVASIKLNKQEQEDATKKAQDAQTTALTKAEEADEAAPNDSTLNWVLAAVAIVGTIAAIAAAVVTFGALAPLAAASGTATAALIGTAVAVGTVSAAATAGMAVADAAVRDAGTKVTRYDGTEEQMDVSWGGMVSEIVDSQLESGSMVEVHKVGDKWLDRNGQEIATELVEGDPDKYKTADAIKDWKTAWTVVANVLNLLVSLAGAYGSFSAAAKIAKLGIETAKLTSKVDRIAETVSTVADIAGAGTSVYQGVKTIEVAGLRADSERARASRVFYDAMLKDIMARMKISQDTVQQLSANLNDMYDQTFSGLADANKTISNISHNMG